jgi:single-stranded DNA-binding protein
MTMDKNVLILTGALVSATERAIGTAGRMLTEIKVAVARPGRKGEGEIREVVPIVIWAPEVGAAVRALPEGMLLTVLGRVSAREWTAPSGQAKTFLEVVGEHVLVDATMAALDEPADAAPRSAGHPEPARPGGSGRGRADGDVPF